MFAIVTYLGRFLIQYTHCIRMDRIEFDVSSSPDLKNELNNNRSYSVLASPCAPCVMFNRNRRPWSRAGTRASVTCAPWPFPPCRLVKSFFSFQNVQNRLSFQDARCPICRVPVKMALKIRWRLYGRVITHFTKTHKTSLSLSYCHLIQLLNYV